MNERDASGLPLRAMVMVLLFLGVVFLLIGFQAMTKDNDSDSAPSSPLTSSVKSPEPSPTPQERPKSDVRVFNISEVAGAAENAATRLREAGWNVTETGNLTLEDVSSTTVFYGEAAGEHESADEIGKVLAVPVQARVPSLAEQPPGVIVVVTG